MIELHDTLIGTNYINATIQQITIRREAIPESDGELIHNLLNSLSNSISVHINPIYLCHKKENPYKRYDQIDQ